MAKYANYCAIRDQRQMSDYAVAKAANITKSTFSDWKKGRSAPKLEKLRKIANVLGVTVDDLV